MTTANYNNVMKLTLFPPRTLSTFIEQVIGTIRATDRDEQTATFSFSLMEPSSNFSVIDNKGEATYFRT